MKHIIVLCCAVLLIAGCATSRTTSLPKPAPVAETPKRVEVAPKVIQAVPKPTVEVAPKPVKVVHPETLVHPDAMAESLRCVCQTAHDKKACIADPDRRLRVAEGLVVITKIAKEFHLPSFARPIMAAVACGESGFYAMPTCGADSACVDTCMDKHGWTTTTVNPKQFKVCTTSCGGTERCNDGGTSAGMFQFKWNQPNGRVARSQGVDLYNPEQSARFYIGRLLDAVRASRGAPVAKRLRGDCGRMSGQRLWMVALYRLGRGPTLSPSRTTTGTDLRTGEVITTKTKRIPRCSEGSKYGRWAAAWAKKNPDAWLPLPSAN